MMTIVPQPKRPSKPRAATTVTDTVAAKPVRHLAILPSAKKQTTKEHASHTTILSGIFYSKRCFLNCSILNYRNVYNV
jgi:hypothetical protein